MKHQQISLLIMQVLKMVCCLEDVILELWEQTKMDRVEVACLFANQPKNRDLKVQW